MHEDDPGDVAGAGNLDWVFAEDQQGQRIEIDGRLVDGFFEVAAMHSTSGQPMEASRTKTREACLDTISRIEGREQLMLGWVMAARAREEVNVPPVYPEETASGDKVTRIVIFGDSLTDTGRLKERLKDLPIEALLDWPIQQWACVAGVSVHGDRPGCAESRLRRCFRRRP